MKDLTALIIAAETDVPSAARVNVLQPICGTPILRLVCNAVVGLKPEQACVVVGTDTVEAQASLEGLPALLISQTEPLRTGYEFLKSWDQLRHKKGDLLFLYGHTPRVKTEILKRLVEHHRNSDAATTLLTAHAPHYSDYNRILRGSDGQIRTIGNEENTAEASQATSEVKTGFHCFRIVDLMQALEQLSDQKNPLCISHIVETQRRNGQKIETLVHGDIEELRAVPTFRELAAVSQALRMEKNLSLMDSGVTLIDPEKTYVDLEVEVEKGAILYPMVTLEGRSHVGAGSVIHSNTRIVGSTIGPNVVVLDCCLIIESEVGAHSTVGPFSHLRSQAKIGERCRIGNYVEIKKSRFGNGSKAAHLAYLGDAILGEKVNIGAGAITCNYDGTNKYQTVIEDEVFVGTDSQLIAPVRIGKGSYIAAGSCITKDVPPESLAIARSRQTTKTGWKRLRKGKNRD